jgi:type II secretion system protein G
MNKKGFTLIELLIVVAIIGIVATIAIPNLLIAMEKGKQKVTMGDLKSIGTSIDAYITDWSIAPQDDDFIETDASLSWFQPFYIKIVPKRDGWGHHFGYDVTADTDTYSAYSCGRGNDSGNVTALTVPSTMLYMCTRISDFNQDVCFSNGYFTVGPNVKR